MVNRPPPAYEEVVTRRVDRHYLTCTRPNNEESLKPSRKHRVDTFAVRCWIASNGGTTAAVGPWWMKRKKPTTWEVFKPTPDQITKPTRSTKEKLIQALRSLLSRRTASIFAMNGTPIQPGEIEYIIDTAKGEHDWTKKGGWRVTVIAYTYAKHVGCSRWILTCLMFLEDLPSLFQAGGIPWKDAMVHNTEVRFEEDPLPNGGWNWVRSSSCSSTSASGQRWKTRVDERHWKQSSLELDFRYRLSAETLKRVHIYQKTGPGKYKTVMIYDLDTVYANDISGQRVEVWNDGLTEMFAEFIRPLMPYDPYPETKHDVSYEMVEKKGER